MDRVEIKNKAKEMIKGNKWYLWKPLVIVGLGIFIIELIAFGLDSALGLTKTTTTELLGTTTTQIQGGIITIIATFITSIISSAFAVAYAMYILSFVRGRKLEVKDVLDFMKKHWVKAFLLGLLVGLVTVFGMLLLVVPGIIAAIGFIFYQEVCADNTEMKVMDMFHKSWEITKGHKMDIFVMLLSFIGWYILAGFTFGILYIWLVPYVIVSMTMVYEKLK